MEWNAGKRRLFHWSAAQSPPPMAEGGGGVIGAVAMATPQTPQYRFFTSLIDLSNDVNATLPTRPSYLFQRIDPECSLTSTSGAKSRDWLSPALFNFSLPFLCLLFFLHLLLFLLFLFFFSSGSPVSQGIQPIRNISTVEMIFNCWQYLDVYQPCGFDIRLGFVTRLIYCRFGNVFLGHVFIVNFFLFSLPFIHLLFFFQWCQCWLNTAALLSNWYVNGAALQSRGMESDRNLSWLDRSC